MLLKSVLFIGKLVGYSTIGKLFSKINKFFQILRGRFSYTRLAVYEELPRKGDKKCIIEHGDLYRRLTSGKYLSCLLLFLRDPD